MRASTSSVDGGRHRKDAWLTRRLPSAIANKLISWSTGVKLHDYGCSLKVFRSEVVKPLKLYGEMHRFLPAIASEMGVTISEVEVNHRARQHGTVEVRPLENVSRRPGLADGEVSAELLDAPASDVRPDRRADGAAWVCSSPPISRTSASSATNPSPTARCCCSRSCSSSPAFSSSRWDCWQKSCRAPTTSRRISPSM